jgi:hypothetical protein
MAETAISAGVGGSKLKDDHEEIRQASDSSPPKEVCKQIAGFPSYEVSNMGRVRSWLGKNPPTILKGGTNSGGYRTVNFSRDGEQQSFFVSHLVACTFLSNGRRKKGLVVTHLNGDKQDNRDVNLAWRSQRDNMWDKHRHGTMPLGEVNTSHKLTEAQVREIRADTRPCIQRTFIEMGSEYGVNWLTIRRVKLRQSWVGVR